MNKKPKKINIEILYKDKNLMVLNKPAGLITHPDGRTEEPSLSEWLVKKYPKVKGVGEVLHYEDGRDIQKDGIVHRLDRETSGAIIVALNNQTFEFLKNQFQNREVRKIYHVFLYGELKKDEGKIDREIGRSGSDRRRWSSERGAKGFKRDALTLYKVVWRGEGVSFVEVEPKTGRTHQIRVHFKAIGYPVVSDSLYAPNKEKALGFERTALHSRSIEFKNLEGEDIKIEAPYPSDFLRAIKKCGIKDIC